MSTRKNNYSNNTKHFWALKIPERLLVIKLQFIQYFLHNTFIIFFLCLVPSGKGHHDSLKILRIAMHCWENPWSMSYPVGIPTLKKNTGRSLTFQA